MNDKHIKQQLQGYRDMQSLAYDEIDVHTLLAQVIETIESLSAENKILKDRLSRCSANCQMLNDSVSGKRS